MVMERYTAFRFPDVRRWKERHQHVGPRFRRNARVKVFFTQFSATAFSMRGHASGKYFVSHEHPENPQYIGVIDCGIVVVAKQRR